MRVLGLVPARGGSKGVPRKNLKPLHGRPLLAYTAESALAAASLSRVVLSTEDEEIAEAGERLGLEVPFRRPAELAADDTPMLPVVQHALRALEAAGDRFDAVCLLQPTTPLRRSRDIDACTLLLAESGADAVVTVLPVPPDYNPHWVYVRDALGALRLCTGESVPIARRQDLPAAWHREGSVYVTRRHIVMESGSLYGVRLMGHEVSGPSVNVDTAEDWTRAEALIGEAERPTFGRDAARVPGASPAPRARPVDPVDLSVPGR